MRTSSVDTAIVDALTGDTFHLTSQEIYERIRGRLPAVNLSTVYRALDRLVQQDRVSVSDMGKGANVYELVTTGEHHHHLVCEQCGGVMTITGREIQQLFKTIERKHRFKVVSKHLILYGICENCQKAADVQSEL